MQTAKLERDLVALKSLATRLRYDLVERKVDVAAIMPDQLDLYLAAWPNLIVQRDALIDLIIAYERAFQKNVPDD